MYTMFDKGLFDKVLIAGYFGGAVFALVLATTNAIEKINDKLSDVRIEQYNLEHRLEDLSSKPKEKKIA